MPNTIVEQLFERVYSKGISLSVSTSPVPASTGNALADGTAMTAWLNAFRRLAGVRSIGGPSLGRDTLDINELDLVPVVLNSGETAEMFYTKPKAPGDKEVQPVNLTLNMTNGEFDWLYNSYMKDLVFGCQIRFPSGAVMVWLGFVDSLEATLESSKIVEVACDLQPTFGVDYVSLCPNNNALRAFWLNYLPDSGCPAVL